MIQFILVILTFILAVGYLIMNFIWNPFASKGSNKNKPGDHSDCGKCAFIK